MIKFVCLSLLVYQCFSQNNQSVAVTTTTDSTTTSPISTTTSPVTTTTGPIATTSSAVDYTKDKVNEEALDCLLWHYNHLVHPGPKLVVAISAIPYNLDLNPDKDSLDVSLYFEQSWTDPRLVWKNSLPCATSSKKFLRLTTDHKIWMPDTYFGTAVDIMRNQPFHHAAEESTEIYPDGRVVHKMSLTLTIPCAGTYHRYPFDVVRCHIHVSTYGYAAEDLSYEWNGEIPVYLNSLQTLPHYSLKTIYHTDHTIWYPIGNVSKAVSNIGVSLEFDRLYGSTVARIILPCCVLAILAIFAMFCVSMAYRRGVVIFSIAAIAFLMTTSIEVTSGVTALDIYMLACLTQCSLILAVICLVEPLVARNTKGGHQRIVMSEIDQENTASNETSQAASNVSLVKNGPKSNLESRTRPQLAYFVSKVALLGCFALFNIVYWSYYMVTPKESY